MKASPPSKNPKTQISKKDSLEEHKKGEQKKCLKSWKKPATPQWI
jgi:hypothetical protein